MRNTLIFLAGCLMGFGITKLPERKQEPIVYSVSFSWYRNSNTESGFGHMAYRANKPITILKEVSDIIDKIKAEQEYEGVIILSIDKLP